MKRVIVGLLLLAVLLTACAGGQPDLVLEEGERDIGTIPNGEVRTFEVVVENRGTAELVIQGVSTSCGCTTAMVEPLTLAPGAKGRLVVTYDSGAHGPEFSGKIMRQVFIASNDPEEPEVEFRFTAEVVPATP